MISLAEARARVLTGCVSARPVAVAALDALGLVLAEDVFASEDVPPFANTAMDGFAVHASDLKGASSAAPVRLPVVGTLAAGHAFDRSVAPGEALRIMTGAPWPAGADAVAIVETTRTDGGFVEIDGPVEVGAHIRPAGEDLRAGALAFSAGTSLSPGHLGVLCSIGSRQFLAYPAPVVGVVSTGDELVDSGEGLRPGQIRDSNRATLLGLLRRDGFRAVDLGIVGDDEDAIRVAISEGARDCDAVLTSGGVSMGEFDFVRKVLDDMAAMAWMQVAIRPAKPFAFGVVGGTGGPGFGTPVFGLPGNPVSSMVSYELLARPGLRRMAGVPLDRLERPVVRAVADTSLRQPDAERVTYARVVSSFASDGRLHVRSAGGQASNLLWPMAVADGLAVLPPGSGVRAGEDVDVLVLS